MAHHGARKAVLIEVFSHPSGPAGDAPSSVILKMGHLDSAGHPSNTNDREIAFYRDIAPSPTDTHSATLF